MIEDFQTTTHVPEALMRLTETYLALGIPEEAQKSTAVLGANYPGSDWYGRAYKLMEDHPYKPVEPLKPGEQPIPLGFKDAQPVAPGTPGVAPKDEGGGSTGATNTSGAGSGPIPK